MSDRGARHASPDGAIRVGFLTPTLVLGGTSRWMTSLARHLPEQSGQRIRVSTIAVVNNFPVPRSPQIESIAGQYTSVAHGPEALESLCARSDVLVVWGMLSLDRLPAFSGPVVFVGHGHCPWTVRLIRNCAPRVTHWVAVSQPAAQSFPDPSQVAVLHNGIEADRCAPTMSRESLRSAWELGAEEIALGYMGRFASEKNPADCARTVASLGKPYRAVYVGDGYQADEVLHEIGQIAADVVYSPSVFQVGDVLQAFDCFLLTSPSEGFSLALTEAWYCGCPAVCTPVGALPELESAHGKLAVTIPVGASPAERGEAVRQAIAPQNFPVIDRAARVVRRHFTAEAMAQRWAHYLLSIV